ncbi:Dihydrofolate synthase @ Folylpolyglutamate synthase [hydrothermal vent metagenome]|uniref:Dihydrofolate synthase @ Folylpolyglutamate synthase n=1 Tax=hydrothermal vent metagenome TaxID=652676 RepID=A0A1W1D2T8_9ZZZZ
MLEDFLNKKPLYYDEIDYTRMPRVYKRIKSYLPSPKIIHIIGTNGKGTTGRFLATALHHRGYRVGHYTSPHILTFNERIWIDGQDVCDEALQQAHQKLLSFLTQEEAESLSYFEYTTFLAMVLFDGLDFVVLEAGLGGEHDATAVFKKQLTLVTPIDKDHEAFLGSSIKEIATTKLKAIQKDAIFTLQKHQEVYEVAKNLHISWFDTRDFLELEDKQKIQNIAKKLSLAPYLQENLKLSISALKFFGISYDEKDFEDAKLFGRLTHLAKNIIIDVGHNVLAAKAIVKSLEGKKYTLIYNSYKDKEYEKILMILQPIIKEVLLIEIEDQRIEDITFLEDTLKQLHLIYHTFDGKIDEKEEYLVFGSFKVVEAFLGVYNG